MSVYNIYFAHIPRVKFGLTKFGLDVKVGGKMRSLLEILIFVLRMNHVESTEEEEVRIYHAKNT